MTLTEEQIKKQLKILLDEKNHLTNEISNLSKHPDYGDVYDDDAQEITDYDNMLSVRDNLQITLDKVNNAIESIDKGTYGKCKSCKNYIEAGRLNAIPYVDICASCSSKRRW